MAELGLGSRLLEMVQVAKRKADAGGLPLFTQLAEMGYLLLRHRLGPGYYLMARFWRRSVSFAEKCGHWNGRRYLRFVHRVNDPRYFKVSQNKLVEKAFLQTLGIPTTPLLGLFHPSKGQAVDGSPLTSLPDLLRVLGERSVVVFFKPAEGDSGRGVFCLSVATADGEQLLRDLPSGEAVAPAVLLDRLAQAPEGYLLEQAIVQHGDLARLNPSSVNTLRIWVVSDENGFRVVGAFLRIGRARSLVDNTANGGLACAVDLETGTIRYALDLTLDRNEHTSHPDTGIPIKGMRIPHWAAAVELACNALRVLPGASFAGMDIAITETGPVVVEYNVEPNQRGASHFDVPHARLFAGFGPH